MWIAMNDSFVSIVEDRNNSNGVAVRARVKEDLENLFPGYENNIVETEDSDYRFRLFLGKQFVADVIRNRVVGVNYDNFKNSVKEPWRKKAYMDIWAVMFKVQASFYGAKNWWENYRTSAK